MSNLGLKLDGGKELHSLLRELPKRVGTKADRKGVTKAGKIVAKSIKSRAPRESGLLKRAIGSVVKSKSKSGTGFATARIGAKRSVTGEWKGRKRVPARYIHLADHGSKRGQRATRFVEEGWEASKRMAEGVMTNTYRTTVEAEARKLGKL